MGNRTTNVVRNLTWGFFNKIIMVIAPFLTRTVMIYTLGSMYVGLNGLFTSILQVLNLTELGINSAIVFSMYKPLAVNDREQICALMNFYRKAYRIIGFIVLGLGLILLVFLDKLIAGDAPSGINIYILYLMNLLNTVLSYELFAHRSSLLVAAQRNDVVNKVSLLVEVLKSAFQIAMLILFENYYLYTCAILVSTVVNNVAVAAVSKRLFPKYKCAGEISGQQLEQIKIKVKGMIFHKIGGVVLSSVDTIVISAFLGLSVLGIYQNYYYIIVAVMGLFGVIQVSLTATVGNSIAQESVEKNYRDFKKFNYIYIWLAAWCSVCVMCLMQPFMELWVGRELMLSNGLVLLFGLYLFVYKWGDMAYVYQEACGIWWETRKIPLFAAVVNLIVNIVLVQKIGLAGILLSTIIAILAIYNTGIVRHLYRLYFNKAGQISQYVGIQLRFLTVFVITASATVGICSFIVLSPFVELIVRGCICLILPNFFFIGLTYSMPEGQQARMFVKEYICKKIQKNSQKSR